MGKKSAKIIITVGVVILGFWLVAVKNKSFDISAAMVKDQIKVGISPQSTFWPQKGKIAQNEQILLFFLIKDSQNRPLNQAHIIIVSIPPNIEIENPPLTNEKGETQAKITGKDKGTFTLGAYIEQSVKVPLMPEVKIEVI